MSRKKPASISASNNNEQLFQLWTRSSGLVQSLMQILEEGIAAPENLPENWEKIFGAKDSAVANLQKLVAALTVISERLQLHAPAAVSKHLPGGIMTIDDLQMTIRMAERELARLVV